LHTNTDQNLLLDIDGVKGFNNLLERLWTLKYLGLSVVDVHVWSTINGRHVELICDNKIPDMERLLIECILGDDYRRALYNYLKLKQGAEHYDKLYEEKFKTNILGESVKVSSEIYDTEAAKKLLEAIRLGE
jgi:hypothetical protein